MDQTAVPCVYLKRRQKGWDKPMFVKREALVVVETLPRARRGRLEAVFRCLRLADYISHIAGNDDVVGDELWASEVRFVGWLRHDQPGDAAQAASSE